MNPDIHAATQEIAEQRRSIEELIHKIKEAARMMDLATHEIHKRDARIMDLEIECERLRAQLARAHGQIDDLMTDVEQRKQAIETLRKRTHAQGETIRRMHEGEL